MTLLPHLPLHLSHLPGSALYFSQAAVHWMAFRATRDGKHAPSQVYLASSFLYLVLGVLFCSPLD